MADISETAASGTTTTSTTTPRRAAANGAAARTTRTRRTAARRDEDIEAQVAKLQQDIQEIAKTLGRMGERGVGEARSTALRTAADLRTKGEEVVESVQDEFSAVEKQVKDAIREKPLTAVLGALAIGYVIAAITR